MNFYVQSIPIADTFAAGIGETAWNALEQDAKQRLIFMASADIEVMHQQKRDQFNIPWKFGDIILREACLNQLMFLTRTREVRDFVERAQFASDKSFSDGIISIASPGGKKFDPIAKKLIKDFMAERNKDSGRFEFVRG